MTNFRMIGSMYSFSAIFVVVTLVEALYHRISFSFIMM